MAWALVVVAGFLEVAWAVGLKYSEGFTRFWPSVWPLATMALSFWLLSLGMRTLPLGTAYAVWVGIGAVGSVAVGIWLFEEPTTTLRLASVALIIAGIVGLKLASPAAA